MKKILFLGEEEVGKRSIINLLLGLKTFPGNGPITIKKSGDIGISRDVLCYSFTPKLVLAQEEVEDVTGTSLIVAVVTSIRNCISTKKAMDELLKVIPNAHTCVIANKQDDKGMDPTAASKLFNLTTIGLCGNVQEHRTALIHFISEFI